MSVAAVKTLIHRLRKQYTAFVREEISRTVSDAGDLGAETHELCEALIAAENYAEYRRQKVGTSGGQEIRLGPISERTIIFACAELATPPQNRSPRRCDPTNPDTLSVIFAG